MNENLFRIAMILIGLAGLAIAVLRLWTGI